MKKVYYSLLTILLASFSFGSNTVFANPGTASATADTICPQESTTLLLTGYSGSIQWQSFDGSSWVNETNTGFNSDMYLVQPGVTTDYRAMVTDSALNVDSSNVVTIFVLVVPTPVVPNVSRCGLGPVSIGASGIGLTTWYADSLAGSTPIHQGDTFNTNITQNTTYYVSTIDTTSSGGGGSSILITEIVVETPDMLEIANVSSSPVDVTGWKVAISSSYTLINSVNANVQTLSGIIQPGDLMYWTDGTANPWGSNMLWNPGVYPTFTGWACIIDDNDEIVDIVFLNWLASDIATFSANIGGAVITIDDEWTGNGIDLTSVGSLSLLRQGTEDNNNASDFIAAAGTTGVLDPGMVLPFPGGFCESARVPVTASVTPPPAVTISALPSSFVCGADSVTLVPTSSNSAYSYTWTPDPDILSISGDTAYTFVTTSNTFYVLADDGTCVSLDSILVDVGTATTAGVASVATDTICEGYTIPLNLSGSTGVINWQYNTGSGWITPGNPSSMMPEYIVTPLESTMYRAVLTSGGCPSDTSNILSITTSEVSAPTVSDTTLCEGTHLFSANGNGNLYWYSSASNPFAEATGSLTSITVNADTTIYVSASSGSVFDIGKASNVPGGIGQSLLPGHGIGFDVSETVSINRVYVYPFSAGLVQVVLRSSQGGAILHSAITNVSSGGNETAIDLGWVVYPGTGYRMEMGPMTTASLIRNTSGASYPITSPDSDALQITGFLDPNLNTGAAYSYFYNWQVSDGCESQREALNVTVLPLPAVPLITAVGQQLSSTAATSYQWILNGNIIPGATMQSHTAIVSGDYTVQVTGANGCSNTSAVLSVVVGLQELNAGSVSIFPNPVQETLFVEYDFKTQTAFKLQLYNSLGEILRDDQEKVLRGQGSINIDMQAHVPGVYMLVITANDEIRSYKIIR